MLAEYKLYSEEQMGKIQSLQSDVKAAFYFKRSY